MQLFITYTVAGLAVGAIYAIAATGLVVTYTTSGVFNFAHGATGMLAAYTYWQFRAVWHWSAPFALIAVIGVAAPLYGLAVERVLIRPMNHNDFATSLVVTVGLLIFSMGVAQTIWWKSEPRSLASFFGNGAAITLGGVRITDQGIISIALGIAVALGLRFLFFQTRFGVAMRGVVDDRPLMALNGGYPTRLNALSWALGSALAALAGVIQASGPNGGGLQVLLLTFTITNAFAAAILGRLKSIPLTFVGALMVGLLVAYIQGYSSNFLDFVGISSSTGWIAATVSNVQLVLPTIFLFAVLLLVPAGRLKAGGTRSTSTIPVPSLTRSLISAGAFIVFALIAVQFMHSGVMVVQAAEGVAVGVVGLSVVLLTGYGGQISLAQWAFMGLGAWLYGHLSPGGTIQGLIGVGLVTAVVGAVVILPTLRLTGLYLALTTLAFAEIAYQLFFNLNSIMGGGNDARVPRVHLPGLRIGTNKSELVFECALFAILAVLLLVVRRGSLGRLLMATRDSSAACATLGTNLNLTKLLLFAGASGIAGIGGALWGGVEGSVNSNNFYYQFGITLVLLVYIWGIASPTAALLGGLSYSLAFPQISSHLSPQWASISLVLTGFGAISLGRNPNGTVGSIADAWQDLSARWRRPSGRPAGWTPELLGEVRGLAAAGD